MNFIVDAMLPSALSKWLRIKGFDSIHTSELEEGNATDDTILFRLSMETERVVITKDHDFIERLRTNQRNFCLSQLAILRIKN